MKKVLLFTLIAVLFASCSSDSGPKFELEVNINNNSSLIKKKFVVRQKIDGAVVYVDTFKIKKEQFLLKVPYKGTALMTISIPESDVNEIMMVAEEGQIQLNIEGNQSHFGGTLLNDRLQAFYQGNDSISLLFRQIGEDYEMHSKAGSLTPQVRENLGQRRTQLLVENTDRIVAFIKENIDNQIGEYYFMTHYITLPLERKIELNSFATEKLKREFGIR